MVSASRFLSEEEHLHETPDMNLLTLWLSKLQQLEGLKESLGRE